MLRIDLNPLAQTTAHVRRDPRNEILNGDHRSRRMNAEEKSSRTPSRDQSSAGAGVMEDVGVVR
jgi:hypothetical protein